jgi:glycerophosphoryl diester phosphodiesterase
MMALGDLLDLVGGRVPLVIELKSHFDGDRKLATRLTQALAAYRGPVAAMSFDPDQVLALRQLAPNLVRGITAERRYDDAYWDKLNQDQRNPMIALRHGLRTQPHFIAYRVDDLPAPAPWIARNIFGCALLTWTVRTPEQRSRAGDHADQMIFEGFVPNP